MISWFSLFELLVKLILETVNNSLYTGESKAMVVYDPEEEDPPPLSNSSDVFW